MGQDKRILRIGAAAILCALVLRIFASGILDPVVAWLLKPETQSFLLYLETGRIVRFSPSFSENANPDGESPPPFWNSQTVLAPAEAPVFSAEDGALLHMSYACALRPDLEKLLTQPLEWDLTGEGPRVLILHTHTTESYTRHSEHYTESSAYRTLDENYNMLFVGQTVAEILEAGGISVIHDRTLHDYPSYNGSYNHARNTIAAYLEEYPTIQLVLDLHRDASGDLNNQLKTQATVDGVPSAQLMLVIGTNAAGLKHPDWEENLALGLKIQAQLEKMAPGITRPINLRTQRFNQDMTPGSLLIEVGAAGNSHDEARLAAETLARAIVALAQGANRE